MSRDLGMGAQATGGPGIRHRRGRDEYADADDRRTDPYAVLGTLLASGQLDANGTCKTYTYTVADPDCGCDPDTHTVCFVHAGYAATDADAADRATDTTAPAHADPAPFSLREPRP